MGGNHMKKFEIGKEYFTRSICDSECIFSIKGIEVRQMVNRLRRKGIPIASSGSGYFYAATEQEVRATIAHLTRRISGIAAAILGALFLIFTETNRPAPTMADTFTDPEEAAVVAQNALAFMSRNLNKGLGQVNEAGQEITKINKIVNKHLND